MARVAVVRTLEVVRHSLTRKGPYADHAGWGGALHQLEGATIRVDDGRFTDVVLRRRPPLPQGTSQ